MNSEAMFAELGRFTLLLSVALLAVMALRPLLTRRFGAACAYFAWLLVPAMLLVALLPASGPGQSLQHLLVSVDTLTTRAAPRADLAQDWMSLPAAPVLVLWTLGVLGVAITITVRHRRFMAGLQRAPDGINWQGPAGCGPALVGLLRPALCLPADFQQRFDITEQRLILAHERVHQRRFDNGWNLLATMVCALQWFNPLAWLALRLLRVDQELSCDAAVLAEPSADISRYASALLAAQQPPLSNFASGLPWASWRSSHPLVERVAMLKLHASARRMAGTRLLVLLALAGAGAVHAIQAEPSAAAAPVEAHLVKVRLGIDGSWPAADKPVQRHLSPTLITPTGTAARVTMDGKPDEPRLDISLTVNELGNGRLEIKSELRSGEPWRTLAKPRLITADGQPARIDIGEKDGTHLTVNITASLLPPGTDAKTAMR